MRRCGHVDWQRHCLTVAHLRGLILLLTVLSFSSSAEEITKSTFTYKKVGDLEIKLDVYRSAGNELQPVLVWIHGGGLILGGRGAGDKHLRETFAGNGSMIVSIDYRLAPETKLGGHCFGCRRCLSIYSRKGARTLSSRSKTDCRRREFCRRLSDAGIGISSPSAAGRVGVALWLRRSFGVMVQ